jgi:hypothetical protein
MSNVLKSWHPVTHDFGLIEASLSDVASAFTAWHQSIGIEYVRKDIESSLAEAFDSLLPLANSKMRRLFVQTRSNWVAFFQNGIQGSDPFPTMSYLAHQMGVPAMRVCCTDESAKYQATIWEVYSPGSPLGLRRSIAAANDGGKWVFEESGDRYPFELTDRYQLPRKRDRFTPDMLRQYLAHFGIDLLSDDFMHIDYTTPAVRLQQITKVWHSPEFTLEEVVAGKPWQRG